MSIMVASQHSQSLAEFRQNVDETLRRVSESGDTEIITEAGEAKAVLLAPAAYQAMQDEIQLARDVEIIRRGMKDIDEGRGRDADEFFNELEGKLLKMQAQQASATK